MSARNPTLLTDDTMCDFAANALAGVPVGGFSPSYLSLRRCRGAAKLRRDRCTSRFSQVRNASCHLRHLMAPSNTPQRKTVRPASRAPRSRMSCSRSWYASRRCVKQGDQCSTGLCSRPRSVRRNAIGKSAHAPIAVGEWGDGLEFHVCDHNFHQHLQLVERMQERLEVCQRRRHRCVRGRHTGCGVVLAAWPGHWTEMLRIRITATRHLPAAPVRACPGLRASEVPAM